MQHEQMLALCHEIESISVKMADFVRVGDWDALLEMDTQVSARIGAIQSAGGFGMSLSAKEREAAAVLITRILSVQQCVRQAIQEKTSDLTSMLTTNAIEQKLSNAYGVPLRK